MRDQLPGGTTEDRLAIPQFDIDHEYPFDDPPPLGRPEQPVPIDTHTLVDGGRAITGTDVQNPRFASRGGGVSVDIDDVVTEQVLGGAAPIQQGPDQA